MKRVVLVTASAAAILAAVLVLAGFSSSGTVRGPEQPVSTSGHATEVTLGPVTGVALGCIAGLNC
jgi:hypothetical protein